jgi:hypothetical protein
MEMEMKMEWVQTCQKATWLKKEGSENNKHYTQILVV